MRKLILCSLMVLLGCDQAPPPPPPSPVEQVKPSLPGGATNVEDMGNGWFTFELNDRKFLFQRTVIRTGGGSPSSPAIDHITQSIVEIGAK
jgi:hypothetical protein